MLWVTLKWLFCEVESVQVSNDEDGCKSLCQIRVRQRPSKAYRASRPFRLSSKHKHKKPLSFLGTFKHYKYNLSTSSVPFSFLFSNPFFFFSFCFFFLETWGRKPILKILHQRKLNHNIPKESSSSQSQWKENYVGPSTP